MKTDERIAARLRELIKHGNNVSSSTGSEVITRGNRRDTSVEQTQFHAWRTKSLSILATGFGKDSIHYETYTSECTKAFKSNVMAGNGILGAALDDLENGHLFDYRKTVEADIFDDFLEQANHLSEQGYYQASVVVAGAVLEDGLRKLCAENNIELPEKPKLDMMNALLAKEGIYQKLTQKKITALADIRNSAAHGKLDQFDENEVKKMLVEVADFMEKYLS
ncbi:HEPN domain-containing protein [Rubinisphaera italica]|uniref:HEPN domain-containing protein n=1 Tax=Rubinisphaera italica TaxID=2527969 RepID=A0A5C5XK03_9PLAN|nr:HEPN domain-containing protein [Rubinisphaera italica]TWT62869.1 hypothetical protein Pan54_36150 [Rubinisphaera italica]